MDESAGDVNAEEEKNVRKAAYAQEECVIDRHCFFFFHHCCIQLLYLKEKNLLWYNIIVII